MHKSPVRYFDSFIATETYICMTSMMMLDFTMEVYCYIVGLGLNCKFIDLLFKCSFIKFIEISLHLDFIVSEIICKQTDTLNQGLIHQRQF